ncbi:TetR/AcrR family transcriptional regulator [Streptomyces sp. S1D4-11]|nr:TetR/AcrR family transcriptional regulator [Streptomyces sp. S1D4-11]
MKPTARERLLAAANELFYAEGVQSVGVDRVIERAGVAKATLYSIFGGKEGLVRAYLQAQHASTVDRITDAVAQFDDPTERLLAIFDSQGILFAQPEFHGCAFVSATAETQRGSIVEQAADDYRAWVRSLFTALAYQAGAQEPEVLAAQLHLLYDGAALCARMDYDASAAFTARGAAALLLNCAAGGSRHADIGAAVTKRVDV